MALGPRYRTRQLASRCWGRGPGPQRQLGCHEALTAHELSLQGVLELLILLLHR